MGLYMNQMKTQDLFKKYKLTDEETKNIKGRELSIEYLQDLIQRDIGMYVQFDIMKRLDIEPNKKFQISKDRKWIEVSEESEIITTANGKV